jgi:hypothetical protein
LFVPTPGIAQVDVGFNIGFYAPIGSMVERGSKSMPATFFQQRLQATPTLAANVTVWKTKRLGFSGTLGFSPADVAQTDTTGTHDHKTSVVIASARVIYAFSPMEMEGPKKLETRWKETPWSFYVGGGVGVVSRSGGVWNYSSGLTSPALLFNVGVRTPLSGRTVLRFDVDDLLSRAQFDKGLTTQTTARTHNDLIFTISFARRITK